MWRTETQKTHLPLTVKEKPTTSLPALEKLRGRDRGQLRGSGRRARTALMGVWPHAAIALHFPLRDSYDRFTILQCNVMKCRFCSFPFLFYLSLRMYTDSYCRNEVVNFSVQLAYDLSIWVWLTLRFWLVLSCFGMSKRKHLLCPQWDIIFHKTSKIYLKFMLTLTARRSLWRYAEQ